MDSLQKDGYLLMRNVIPKNRIQYAQEQVSDEVFYGNLNIFFRDDMLGTVNRKLGLELVHQKYRVSNSSNSSDAGSFHRDLQSYEPNSIPSVFTCLTYLDDAMMELIPETHKHTHISFYNVFSKLNTRKTIKVKPGDILLFHASILHRGIFYETKSINRRLIQLFDCVNRKQLPFYRNSILHIPCRNNCSSFVSQSLMSLHNMYVISECINLIGYFSASKGYGYPYYALPYITSDKHIKYLSTESNRGRLQPTGKGFEKQNLYVVNVDNIKNIEEDKRDVYLIFTFIIDILLFIIILIVIIYLSFKLINRIKLKKTNTFSKLIARLHI